MTYRTAPDTIPLSALNTLIYCPRRFHYQFVQGDTLVNELVLEGTLLHKRVHTPGTHMGGKGDIQTTHLYLYSETLHLSGFTDIVEEQEQGTIPIEYKRGKQGQWLNDAVQLCAQALCLEERQPQKPLIPYGYIYYIESRNRVQVPFTKELRSQTREAIAQALQIAMLDTPPPPLEGKQAMRCQHCSLLPLCLPDEVKLLHAKN